MDKPTTNAVRQVLMNELGLTREAVRAEMTSLVAAEAAKVVQKFTAEGLIDRCVRAEVDKLVKGTAWTTPDIRQLVTKAAEAQVAQFVASNLKIGGGRPLDIQVQLRGGERYVGVIVEADEAMYHLILREAVQQFPSWGHALREAAESGRYVLPTVREYELIQVNCRNALITDDYWTSEAADEQQAYAYSCKAKQALVERRDLSGPALFVRRVPVGAETC